MNRDDAAIAQAELRARYADCRRHTLTRVEGLSDADLTVQSMDDASPGKWHLAHTTWFFETFVLAPLVRNWKPFHPQFTFLFNSYYEAVGARLLRPHRGLLTRPTLAEVLAYRRAIDAGIDELFLQGTLADDVAARIELGIQHEQQHQELLLTDLLHLFAQNPLRPALGFALPALTARLAPAGAWLEFSGGPVRIGHAGPGFAFDCERPAHAVVLHPYALAADPVRNRDWQDFIDDDGYRQPTLWLADGWDLLQTERWRAPLYWRGRGQETVEMTLSGELPLDPHAPVCHISYFEADAFARWAGKRLPTEAEWEHGQRALAHTGLVWEWTASTFAPYPGFRAARGAIGEYNGKFMCDRYVLRGGSRATPAEHLRPSYRNFFRAHQRWQFSGLRLAEDRS